MNQTAVSLMRTWMAWLPAIQARLSIRAKRDRSFAWSGACPVKTSTLVLMALAFIFLAPAAFTQLDCLGADTNFDGIVDDADLATVIFCFGETVDPPLEEVDPWFRGRLSSKIPPVIVVEGDPISLDRSHFVYGTRDDLFFINVGRSDLERIGQDELERGIIIGYLYVYSAGGGGIGLNGGYGVKVLQSPVGWTGQLIDLSTGTIARSGPALIDQNGPYLPQAEITGSLGRDELCIDFHWGWFNIIWCFVW